MKTKLVTRAEKRKAKKDLEAKLCLRAMLDIGRRIERMPKRLQQRTVGALWTLIAP